MMTRIPANRWERLPAPWRAIGEEIRRAAAEPSNLPELVPVWEDYAAQVRAQVRGATVEEGGEVVSLGPLSPGCQACSAGTWDCIFLTMRCNLACPFCYSPRRIARDYAGSVFGSTPEEIQKNHAGAGITGIGFSGGEPFLEKKKLLEWVAWFRRHSPGTYLWMYTNGVLADEAGLRELGASGLDEIRFNMAAGGYDHPEAMRNLGLAAKHIPHVTVEIPSIPEHGERLLGCIREWAARGVQFLNLHELLFEPGTNAESMPGPRTPIVLEDGHHTAIHSESRKLTLAVMTMAAEDGLALSVHDCSLQSKLRQQRGRRRALAGLTGKPYEEMRADGTLESYGGFRNPDDYFYCHPESLPAQRAEHPDFTFVRFLRLAPLAPAAPGRWLVMEEAGAGDG